MIQSVWKNLTGLQKAAEHLWCDFKWDTNSSPNTNDLYIHYMDKSTPSLEEKKALPNCANKDINVLKNVISTSVATVLKCMKYCIHMYKSLVFGDEFWLIADRSCIFSIITTVFSVTWSSEIWFILCSVINNTSYGSVIVTIDVSIKSRPGIPDISRTVGTVLFSLIKQADRHQNSNCSFQTVKCLRFSERHSIPQTQSCTVMSQVLWMRWTPEESRSH